MVDKVEFAEWIKNFSDREKEILCEAANMIGERYKDKADELYDYHSLNGPLGN